MKFFFLLIASFILSIIWPHKSNGSSFPILSDSTTISLLTESPASDFYTAWGHSAIRINDRLNKIDEVFNFGTFDFNDEYFYLKFIQGSLRYTESIYNYSDYLASAYQDPHRIVEQELNLSQLQKQKISDELFRLYLPENRYYLYDWTKVNCSTKLRDVLQTGIGKDFFISNEIKQGATSFREHEEPYLYSDLWMKFATNIVIGSPADRLITPYEETFMPDGLYGALKTMRLLNGQTLISSELIVLQGKKSQNSITLISPVLLFWLLFLAVVGFSFNATASRMIDLMLFSICGLLGIFFLYLWFVSDHAETRYNWNILWAFPLHLIYPALRNKARKYYSFFIVFLTILMLSAWGIIPQKLEPAVIAILMIQNTRALFNLGMQDLLNKVFSPPT